MQKKFFFILFGLLLLSSSVFAQIDTVAVEKAIQAIGNGDYETAYPVFKELADQGNAIGQYAMGSFHENGIVVEQDINKAFDYYLLAAQQNYPEAAAVAGMFYYLGKGVEPNDAEALKLLLQPAEMGFVQSQFMVGDIYCSSGTVPNNLEEGIKWFTKAADQGYAEAQYKLGMVYSGIGYDIEADNVKSLMFFYLAAEQGHEFAKTMMESMAELLTPEQRNEAADRVKFWKMKHQ